MTTLICTLKLENLLDNFGLERTKRLVLKVLEVVTFSLKKVITSNAAESV